MTPEAAAAKIRAARKKIAPKVTKFHYTAAELVRDARAKAFQNSMAPDGSKWDVLKPATIAKKKGEHKTKRMYAAKKGDKTELTTRIAKKSATPDKPLLDTGVMSKPTIKADKTAGRVIMAKSRALPVHGDKSIGGIHNEGTEHIPKREHWAIYPDADKAITKAWNALKAELIEDIGL